MSHRHLSLLLVLGLFTPVPTLALEEDRNQPIQLEADRARLDQKTGVSVYEGNVIISQGSMRLGANTVTIHTADGKFQRMEATGNPATFKLKPAPDKEEIHGQGRYIDYDAVNSKLILSDKAKVTQSQTVFEGDRIEYDLDKDLVNAKSTTKRGRIKITLPPQKSPIQ